MHWSECHDEMKMADFLEQITEEEKLRRFALELACTVLEELKDQRLIDAVDATEDFLNGAIGESDLARFHTSAETAVEEIEAREMNDFKNGIEDAKMEYEKGLVVLYAAIPPSINHYRSSLEAARDSALHAAHYCRQIRGDDDLSKQMEILVLVELPSNVTCRTSRG